MTLWCTQCEHHQDFVYSHDYTDSHGIRWEVYKCRACGKTRWFAVA